MWTDGEWHGPFIKALLKWLGYDGVAFFSMVQEEYGSLLACWSIPLEPEPPDLTPLGRAIRNARGVPSIPHSVHFREGMQVRNKMRDLHKVMGYGIQHDHTYDNTWEGAVKACLHLCEHGHVPVYGPEE